MSPKAPNGSGPIVVFAGAGASAHLGFPVGSQLTDQIRREVGAQAPETPVHQLWDRCLKDQDLDFERLLEECDRVARSLWAKSLLTVDESPRAPVGVLGAKALGDIVRRSVVEAFDVPTRMDRLPDSPWLRLLPELCRASAPVPVRVFTTNYDTAMLFLRHLLDPEVQVLTGFRDDGTRWTWDPGYLTEAMDGGSEALRVVYVQLHGGVAWERRDGGNPTECRNPLTLAGESIYDRVLVWPAAHKHPYEEPFWTHHECLVRSLEEARAVLFIGYGFNDEALGALMRMGLNGQASGGERRVVLWDADPRDETYLRALDRLRLKELEHVQTKFGPEALQDVLKALGVVPPGPAAQVRVPEGQRAIFERAVRAALALGPDDVIGAKHLAGVTDLRLADEQAFSDDGLSLLMELPNLLRLNLDNTAVSTVGPLTQLTKLQRLYLSLTTVSDLQPLRGRLPDVWELGLWHTQVSDVSPLKDRTNLRVLNLEETPIDDSQVEHLGTLTGLVWLQLSAPGVSNLSGLGQLGRLRTLYTDNTQVHDLSPLERLPALRTVFLRGTKSLLDAEVTRFRSVRPDVEILR